MHDKTKKSKETKHRLRQSALELINQKGFDGATVKAIVDGAGYAKGTFYLYWETKYDMLMDLVKEMYDVFGCILKESLSHTTDNPFHDIDLLLDRMSLMVKKHEAFMKMIHTPDILILLRDSGYESPLYTDEMLVPIITYVEICIQKGFFRQVDPAIYSKLLFIMVHSLFESATQCDFPVDIDTVKEELKLLIRKMLTP
ncbi:MAG: TetR family transcriptional regulator [Bacillota bacterium]|nr:MAG: TetR family transcriptional regulator [Bacillota bacterium]